MLFDKYKFNLIIKKESIKWKRKKMESTKIETEKTEFRKK